MSKILFVSNFYSSFISAGTSKRTRDIKKGLSNLGWECKVLTIKRANLPLFREPDKKEIIAINCFTERFPIPLFNPFKLLNLIRSNEIIHIIDHWSMLNILCVYFCISTKTPYIFSPCGAVAPIGRNIGLKKLYNLIFLKSIINNAACCFATTKDEQIELKNLSNKKTNIKVFPNGIWEESNILDKKPFLNKNKLFDFKIPKKYILFIGRLSYIKGPDILLRAFLKTKLYRKYSLIFAGPDDNMKNEMISFLKKGSEIKNIFFLGSISPDKRDFFIENSVLTVIPSRKEAMSMVALESSYLGKAFLASKNCGLQDFYRNDSCFIYGNKVKGLTKKLDEILSNPKKIKRIGLNAKEYVLSNYMWDSILNEMSLYLKKLI